MKIINVDSRKTLDKIINILFIVSIFEAYKISDFYEFPLTLVIILMGIAYIMGSILLFKNAISGNINLIVLIFIIYAVINFTINDGSELTSLFLLIFFFSFIWISKRDVYTDIFEKYISVYIKVTSIISFYAIYQIFARALNLPFADIIFENNMVTGYNWTNYIFYGGTLLYRSNGIYREPSILSQYTALTIIFIIIKMKNGDKRYIFALLINIIAFLVSFSGSGFLVLAFWILFNIKFSIKKVIKSFPFINILGAFILAIAYFYKFDFGINYFLGRTNEVFNNKLSGGARYRGPFELLRISLEKSPLFGFGPGTREFIKLNLGLFINVGIHIDSTIPRIGIELGIIGIFLWIIFIISILKAENFKNKYYYALVIFIFIQMFNGEYFLSTTYWPFLYLINCKLQDRIL